MIVNVHEAKSTLSKLLKAAMEGEEVIIAKSGKPLVRLQPITRADGPGPGRFAGKIKMEDFFAPLEDSAIEAWEK